MKIIKNIVNKYVKPKFYKKKCLIIPLVNDISELKKELTYEILVTVFNNVEEKPFNDWVSVRWDPDYNVFRSLDNRNVIYKFKEGPVRLKYEAERNPQVYKFNPAAFTSFDIREITYILDRKITATEKVAQINLYLKERGLFNGY